MPSENAAPRNFIARGFSLVEDAVYIGLGLLLAAAAVALLVVTGIGFAPGLVSGEVARRIVPLLDQLLLVLLVVELLYTVQVSFREHAVTPEPFLLVGLIASIRRVLILTAEFGHPGSGPPSATASSQLALELGVLALLIVAIAVSLFILRRRDTTSRAARA